MWEEVKSQNLLPDAGKLTGLGLLLKNYIWQLLRIFRPFQPNMGLVHCSYFHLWPFSMKLWPFEFEIHQSKSCLGQYSETTHDNCFIMTGQINLAWNLCTVRIFWPFDLQPWKYDIHPENVVQVIAWKLYIILFWKNSSPSCICKLQLVSSQSIENYKWSLLHIFRAYQPALASTGALKDYFWPLTVIFWPLPWKSCPVHCLETINDNCFIFSGHINLTWDLYTVILTFVLDIMTLDFEIFFTNSCSAQPRGIQCQFHLLILSQ